MAFNEFEMTRFAVHLETRGVRVDWNRYGYWTDTPPYGIRFPGSLARLELKFPADYSASEREKEIGYVSQNCCDFLISDKTTTQVVDGKTVVTFYFSNEKSIAEDNVTSRPRVVVFSPEPGENNW